MPGRRQSGSEHALVVRLRSAVGRPGARRLPGLIAVITMLLGWCAASAADPARSPLQGPPATPRPAAVAAGSAPEAIATAIRLEARPASTRVTIELSAAVDPAIFLVANPPRVIIDVPALGFQLAPDTAKLAGGLVKALRYGLFKPGQSRLVLDATGPVRISAAELQKTPGRAARLVVSLAPTDPNSFDAMVAEHRPPPAAPTRGVSDDVDDQRASAASRPVVVIDPGHGGVDPGAVGGGHVLEKTIVLQVALRLKALLVATSRYDIVMTRSTDIFVPLDQRLQLSADARADLFVSLHADSAGAMPGAGSVRGATIYTLSEQASDEAARRLAEKENAVDALAGLKSSEPEDSDQVRDILIDLLRRETSNFSNDFRALAIAELKRRIAMSKDPTRSAAFKVLKQTRTPSVLIELGYMSNTQDQASMTTAAWQGKVAQALFAAIEAHFARRHAGGG